MRRGIGLVVLGLAALGACAGESLPKTVDQRWIVSCEGTGTNVHGLTREHACLAAAKGYEDDVDLPHATAFYKHACDLGVGEGCLDWARVLVTRGNIAGARFVLASSPPCETPAFAGKCGWALVASLERDDPPRPSEVPAALHTMCDRHHIAAACKRLALVEEPARMAHVEGADAGAAGAAAVTIGLPVQPTGRPEGCHVESDCVGFELARDEGSCAGSIRVNVTNKCNERVYCTWCQSRGTQVLDRSTCGGHWFEVDQTYRGAVSFCDRATRGDDVMFTCASAKDPPACTRL